MKRMKTKSSMMIKDKKRMNMRSWKNMQIL